MKCFLKSMLEDLNTQGGRYFAFFIQSLILVSLITFSIETLPDNSETTRYLLNTAEAVLVGIFSVEYFLRLYVSDKKLGFVFSFFGLIDLVAILPFYLSVGLDLRSIRVFRLLRLFRLFKLLRYNLAIRRFHRALRLLRKSWFCLAVLPLSCFICLQWGFIILKMRHNLKPLNLFSIVFGGLWQL